MATWDMRTTVGLVIKMGTSPDMMQLLAYAVTWMGKASVQVT